MNVSVGERCRNIFRRRKVSQAPGPQYSSPAKLESTGGNTSASTRDPIVAPIPRSSEAALVQAKAAMAELTPGGEKRLTSKGLALPRDQDDKMLESDDMEIKLIENTIPTVDDVPVHTAPRNSGKAPERDDLEVTPIADLVRAPDHGREQATHGDSSTDNMLQVVAATQLDDADLANDVGASAQPDDPDSKRTLDRYEEAKRQMKNALTFRRNEWGSFDFPQLDTLSEQEGLSALLKEIDKVLDSRSQKNSVVNPTKWTNCKKVVANTFTAISPLVTNVLTIAKEGAQIPFLNPYGLLFGGLMLLITVHSRRVVLM